jgi:hypothetical protein
MQRYNLRFPFPRNFLLVWCVLLVATTSACSRKTRGTPDLAPVSGVVTLDGKPLGDAIVLFTSAAGMSSFGKTDTTGRYTVAYRSHLKGAALGLSVVRITMNLSEQPGPGYKDLIPAKYNSASTLKAEVKPGGNTIDFALSSK